jgi:predicted N-formylglutamate amidohydrolase
MAMEEQELGLLRTDEPGAVLVRPATSDTALFLTCDHASNRIPMALGDLGVSVAERERHIAWDIGAFGVAEALAARFGATLVATQYSRLVIDCNRPLWRDDAIPTRSENTVVPGNVGLSAGAITARQRELHQPYHAEIARLLDHRATNGQPTVYVSIHSFTPVFKGESRPWQVALLSNRDRRVADILLRELRQDSTLCVGDNIPYRLTDDGDYGVPVHGEQRGLPHVLIEIRQDQITTTTQQQQWVARLAPLLLAAVQELGVG